MSDIVAVNSGLVVGRRVLQRPHAPGAPRLSHVQVELLKTVEVVSEAGARSDLSLPVERPLPIFLNGRSIVTLMTLGAAPELLTLGYLWNQQAIRRIEDLVSVDASADLSTVQVVGRIDEPAAGVGLACALGSALGHASIRRVSGSVPSHADILSMLQTARAHDAIHRAAGSVHSAILFEGSELLIGVEDVSRHNGIDTLSGWLALHAESGYGKSIFTTGRLTAEMVLKAAFNGITTLISRNGTTSAGCEIAARLGMTLIGRAANRRYIRYVGG